MARSAACRQVYAACVNLAARVSTMKARPLRDYDSIQPENALEAAHAWTHLHRRRLYAALAPHRLCARHHARGDPRRGAGGGRVLRRVPAAQPFSRDLRRRRLQRRLRAGLCPCPRRGRRSLGAAVRRPHLHAAVPVAGGPARGRLAVHAAGHEHPGARLFRCTRAAPSRDRADPHHLSLPAADHAGDALWRHAQRDASLRFRRGGVDLPQHRDDGDAGVCRILSHRRPCRGLGRLDLRLPAIFSALRRSRPPRRPAAFCAAEAR